MGNKDMTIPGSIQGLHRELKQRSERWRGDSSSMALSAFSASDQEAIKGLYQQLQALQSAFEEVGYDGAEARQIFDEIVASGQWRQILKLARSIDEEPREGIDRKLFLEVRHDIRAGALTRLLNLFQFAEQGYLDGQEFSQSYLRIRDHTKIMRHAVPDLDRVRYERDSEERIHRVELLLEKWSEARLFDEQLEEQRSVRTNVYCDFWGPVSDRCVEFAALDRVIYNLMNNAIEYAVDGGVDLYITAGGREEAANVLIAVRNKVGQEQARVLRERCGGADLSALMRGGFTTDGHGLGLRICADFVAFAYGVHLDEVIGGGYAGATLAEGHFICWVHWPTVEAVSGR